MFLHQRLARLRFSQLEMLCAVADAGGVRIAAESLHLSAAAVSKSLREIESSLEFSLFERLPRGMIPTMRGERLIAHARLLLHELQGMEVEADSRQPMLGGQIRLGASPYAAARALPQVLSLFPLGADGLLPVTVRIQEGHLSLMLEQLHLGQIEALLTLYTAGDLPEVQHDALAVDQLRPEQIVVLARPGLLPTGRRKVAWAALNRHAWILPPASTHLRRVLDTMFHLESLHPPIPRIEAPHLDGNVRLCAAGLGLTIAPMELAREHVDAGTLAVLPMQRALPESSLALIYRRASAAFLPGLQELRTAARLAFRHPVTRS